MTDTVPLPDFVEEAGTKHPGVVAEYSALKALVRPLSAHRESDDLRHAVLLQSGVAWQHYNAILLLLAHGFGIQGLVLCRTLFEVVVGTFYLIKNPSLLADFTDHGKFLLYEQCLVGGLSAQELTKIVPDFEAIKARQGKRKTPWHQSSIKRIAIAVGLGETYNLLFPDASGGTHADATKTLSHGSRGWTRSLESFRSEQEADIVRYNSFWLIGYVLYEVNKSLDMGHDKEANALYMLMCERAKAAAMPN